MRYQTFPTSIKTLLQFPSPTFPVSSVREYNKHHFLPAKLSSQCWNNWCLLSPRRLPFTSIEVPLSATLRYANIPKLFIVVALAGHCYLMPSRSFSFLDICFHLFVQQLSAEYHNASTNYHTIMMILLAICTKEVKGLIIVSRVYHSFNNLPEL